MIEPMLAILAMPALVFAWAILQMKREDGVTQDLRPLVGGADPGEPL